MTGEEREVSKAFQKSAVDLLIRFHIVIKNAKIYSANNALFQGQVQGFFEALTAFREREGQISLQVRQSALFMNGVRIRFVLGTYPIFKSILEEFRDRETSAVTRIPVGFQPSRRIVPPTSTVPPA